MKDKTDSVHVTLDKKSVISGRLNQKKYQRKSFSSNPDSTDQAIIFF